MRIAPPAYRLLYGTQGFLSPAVRDGLQGSNAHVVDALRTAGLYSVGTLPSWPVGGSEPGESSNGAAGMGV